MRGCRSGSQGEKNGRTCQIQNEATGTDPGLSEKHSDRFVTAEQCMDCLKAEGIHVGQTTVYRALDRLTEENAVIKIPAVDGAGAQYRYIGELRPGSPGRLVCLQCGKIIPLECNKLHGFSEHILKEHDFALDSSHLDLLRLLSGVPQIQGNTGRTAGQK